MNVELSEREIEIIQMAILFRDMQLKNLHDYAQENEYLHQQGMIKKIGLEHITLSQKLTAALVTEKLNERWNRERMNPPEIFGEEKAVDTGRADG